MNSYSGTNIAMGNEPNPVLCSVSAIFKKGRVNSVKTILELHGGSGEIQWNFTVEKFLLSNFLWSHTPVFGHILLHTLDYLINVGYGIMVLGGHFL